MWHVIYRRRTGNTVFVVNKGEFERLSDALQFRTNYHRMHGVWLRIVDEMGEDYRTSILASCQGE